MDTTKGNLNITNIQSETGECNQRKEYVTPKLTGYGDISELVLMNGGDGMDDNMLKTVSIT